MALTRQEFINNLEELLNHPEVKVWVQRSYRSTMELALHSMKKNLQRDQDEIKRIDDLAMKTFQV